MQFIEMSQQRMCQASKLLNWLGHVTCVHFCLFDGSWCILASGIKIVYKNLSALLCLLKTGDSISCANHVSFFVWEGGGADELILCCFLGRSPKTFIFQPGLSLHCDTVFLHLSFCKNCSDLVIIFIRVSIHSQVQVCTKPAWAVQEHVQRDRGRSRTPAWYGRDGRCFLVMHEATAT